MAQPPPDRSHVLDHLGLVAAMCEELGMGAMIDHATQQHPEMRLGTAGHAVKAMGLHGLGLVNQQRSLGPRFFQHKPPSRRITPGIAAEPRNAEALGRALETRSAYGVTALSRLMAGTAAERVGWAPTLAHLDRTRCPVAGRSNSDESPAAHGLHLTRGYSRDHRPALTPVMVERIVAHQAGSPLLRTPLRGNRRAAPAVGEVIQQPRHPLPRTCGPTSVVADSDLDRADNLQQLAPPQLQGMTRVPATGRDAQEAFSQAEPPSMRPLMDGYRDHAWASADGDVAQRWRLIHAEARQPQAPRTVHTQRLKQRDQAVRAVKQLCGTTLAWEAEARHVLSTFAPGLQATVLEPRPIRPTPRDRPRGRPGQGALPAHMVDSIEGALAARLAARQALIDPQRCFILAPTALDDTRLPPQDLLAGSTGQGHAERGFRFRKDPCVLAASRSLKKPERLMALVRVMTVCGLVYAALEDRLRHALQDQGATFPDQQGHRIQNPTARWVCDAFVGIHGLFIPHQWPIVINLTAEHQHRLHLLGKRYPWFSSCIFAHITASVRNVSRKPLHPQWVHDKGAASDPKLQRNVAAL